MKTFKLTLAVVIASVGLSTAVLAQDADKSTTSKSTTTSTTKTTDAKAQKGDRATYRAAKKQADDAYKAAKKQCDAIGTASTGKENCIGIAKAERNYSRAQAQAQYRPTDKNQRDVKMAAVNLEYARAKAKCDTMGGNVKETGSEVSVCMAKANETRNAGLAAAKAGKDTGSSSTMDKAKSATTSKRGDVGQER